eukprot:SM000002S05556  [mRNA]  locus=s2:841619:845267:+ [translate_table: standard]
MEEATKKWSLTIAWKALTHEAVLRRLAALRDSLPHRHQAGVREVVLGPGTGIAYLESPRTSIASDGDFTVIFCGRLYRLGDDQGFESVARQTSEGGRYMDQARRPAIGDKWVAEAEGSEADQVLDLCKSIRWSTLLHSNTAPANTLRNTRLRATRGGTKSSCPCAEEVGKDGAKKVLGKLKGSFAFFAYDAGSRRVIAARDDDAKQPLFWGAPTFGEGLLFSHDRLLIEEEAADADQFPPGTFFTLCPEDGTNGTGVISTMGESESDNDDDWPWGLPESSSLIQKNVEGETVEGEEEYEVKGADHEETALQLTSLQQRQQQSSSTTSSGSSSSCKDEVLTEKLRCSEDIVRKDDRNASQGKETGSGQDQDGWNASEELLLSPQAPLGVTTVSAMVAATAATTAAMTAVATRAAIKRARSEDRICRSSSCNRLLALGQVSTK